MNDLKNNNGRGSGENVKRFGLTANQLKLFAAAFMVCDHVGYYLISSELFAYTVLRAIGRLAFPIFAYFIAEGCVYTKNRMRYLGLMLICAVIAEIIYSVAAAVGFAEYEQFSIFTTFCIAITAIYLLDACLNMVKAKNYKYSAVFGAAFALVLAGALFVQLYDKLPGIEYGFFAVLMIVAVYVLKNRYVKLIGFAGGQAAVALTSEVMWLQSFSLLTVPLMLLYNGRRGKWRMKYFFYIFYPAHIAAIILIGVILNSF